MTAPMTLQLSRLIRAEIFKLRTTSAWWLFVTATVISTGVMVVINCLTAHSLLKPLDQYLAVSSHGHGSDLPPDFRVRLVSEWQLGHSALSQAAILFTSGRLVGVLLACLLGIVLITSEFHHQTATATFLMTPHRTMVVIGKLLTAVIVATLLWLISTVLSVVAGVVFLHTEGYSSQLGHWGVSQAVLLNLAAYIVWAVLGVGLGALIRNQLVATVTATVLYLAGTAASGVFDLLNQYVIQKDWILTAQVFIPDIASAVMVSPTKTFTESPPQWVGAAVLIGYGLVAGVFGIRALRRRDIA